MCTISVLNCLFPQRISLSFVCLFDLIRYVPSTIFQLYRDGSTWVEPVLSLDKCVLLKDHNAVTPVRLEPVALQPLVKHSNTEPLRSLYRSRKVFAKIMQYIYNHLYADGK